MTDKKGTKGSAGLAGVDGPLIILKIGGSVITDRNQDRPRLLLSRLNRIATEIAAARKQGVFRLLIIHGAGSFGHPIVKRTGIHKGLSDPARRIAMGETQRLQTLLNAAVVRSLLRQEVPAFPVQPSASALLEAGRIVSMELAPVCSLLDQGMVPVLNGVPAVDLHQGCDILSGDQIAGHLFSCLQVEKILHGTNVKGVYTTDPSLDPGARFIERIDLRMDEELPEGVCGSSVTDVTGGLRKKLEELRLAKAGGQIFDATLPGNVQRVLMGDVVGTEIICP